MRDLLLILFTFAMLPTCFFRPHIGLYLWSWFGYMLPHTFGWSYAVNFRFVLLVSTVTMAGMLLTKPPRYKAPFSLATVLWVLFTFWCTVTTQYAMNPSMAYWELDRTLKVMLMIWATFALIDDKAKLEHLLLVFTLSLTFYGLRGALFTLLHGGNFRVHGPHGGFFWDNNAVGLAMLLVIPLLRYFYMQTTSFPKKIFYIICFSATMLSIVGTYSRGSILGMAVTLFILVMKTRYRWRWLAILLPMLYLITNFMPEAWEERMHSIQDYEQDRASTGRLNAWQAAINLANDHPLVGGGFQALTRRIFGRYAPDPLNYHDAHSIYFEVLAEQGYVGLVLFLSFYLTVYRYGTTIVKQARGRPDLQWMGDLASMLQVSLVGYASAGSFLGMAYFDLPWHLASCLIILRFRFIQEINNPAPAAVAATAPLPVNQPGFHSIYDLPPPRR